MVSYGILSDVRTTSTTWGYVISVSYTHLKNLLFDNPMHLQLFQLLVDDPRVRFGKMPVNFTRTFRPVFQRVYDTAFPFSADDFHCYLDAAVDIERYFLFVHNFVYYIVQN